MTKYDVPPRADLVDRVYELGLTRKQIAEEYHVSEGVVKRWFKLYGIGRETVDPLLYRAAYVLTENGFSGREAATVLNTTHTRVYEFKRRYKNWREQNGDTV